MPTPIKDGAVRCHDLAWSPKVTDAVIESFWARVDRRGEDECWPWVGALKTNTGTMKGRKDQYGYLSFRYVARCVEFPHGKTKKWAAHRLSYEIHNGKIPKGKLVRHTCNMTHCVNPNHLGLGTHKDNMRDMVESGRSLVGAKNPRALLSKRNIHTIFKWYFTDGYTLKAISKTLEVNLATIGYILQAHTWEETTVPLLAAYTAKAARARKKKLDKRTKTECALLRVFDRKNRSRGKRVA